MRNQRLTWYSGLTIFLLFGCGGAAPWIPLRATPAADPEMTLVWAGRGECERFENGTWVRHAEFDYDFSVEQRRFADHWDSVKSLRRHHPNYDGSAGERTQTWFFRVDIAAAAAQSSVDLQVTSSLGNGTGVADREFRQAELNFVAAGVSSMAPFDRYRIRQTYDYEGGHLTETVELHEGGTPWVRNREVATLFAPLRFDHAPTVR